MKAILRFATLLLMTIVLPGCKQGPPEGAATMPGKDRMDDTARVEAGAAGSNPPQERIDQDREHRAGMGGAPATSTADVINTASFVDDQGQAVVATYRRNGTVSLAFADGRAKVLPQAVSGSGARYAAGGFEWWEHQGEARYSVNDRTVFVGKLEK